MSTLWSVLQLQTQYFDTCNGDNRPCMCQNNYLILANCEPIISGGRKLGILAHKIVLEEDGTEIDEDEILQNMSNVVLMLLSEGEVWAPSQVDTTHSRVPSGN